MRVPEGGSRPVAYGDETAGFLRPYLRWVLGDKTECQQENSRCKGPGASLVAQLVKNLPAMQEAPVPFLGWEDSLEEGMQPTPVFSPGESHGQRSLVAYSL